MNMRFGKGPFGKLRDRGSFATVSELVELVVNLKSFYLSLRVQDPKVQMEELQWGFPIATPLSLNKPLSINGK